MDDGWYDEQDAVGIAGLIAGGQVSALEAVEACLARIDAVDARLHAFVHVDGDAARRRAGGPLSGPLAGVPFAVKDLVGYPGMRCAMGSRLFAGHVPDAHVPYTAALDGAGLVTVGKTATSELGLLGSTETLLEGTTRNPWAEGLSATGSSGGAAAAVAAGILPLAHASDGGGSIRVPASACGLFGFKPTNRRMPATVPMSGGFADFVVEHAVSRSVRDSALLLACTERHDVLDGPVGHVTAPLPRRLRVATWSTTLVGEPPTPEVARALDEARALLEDLGHAVDEVAAPALDGEDLRDAWFTVAGAAMDQLATAMGGVVGRPVGAGDLEPFTLELIDWFRSLPTDARASAPARVAEAARRYDAVFADVDVVLTPTLATRPWPLGHLAPGVGRAELLARTAATVGYTPIHNATGGPAMSVPLHWTDDGVPIGTHLAAASGDDATLLALAYELEEARPWASRRPPRREAAG